MKQKRFVLQVGVAALMVAAGLALTACDSMQNSDTKGSNQNTGNEELSRRETLALQHLQTNHISTEKELSNQLADFLMDNSAARGAAEPVNIIKGAQKFTSTIDKGFASVPVNRRNAAIEAEASEIPFYLFELENTANNTVGFALTCGDERIGNVLAVVENGTYDDDNPFLDVFYSNLGAYIMETIDIYNDINDEEIKAAEAKVKETPPQAERLTLVNNHPYQDTPFEPLIKTKWGQAAPYGDVINSVYGRSAYADSNKYPTGCVATAVAQIMAYHEWPMKPAKTIREPKGQSLISSFKDPYTKKTKSFSNIWYDWHVINGYLRNSYELTNTLKTEIGVLFLEIGSNVSMRYNISDPNNKDKNGSGAYSEDVPAALVAMKYKQSNLIDYDIRSIKSSINVQKPVYISASAIETTTMIKKPYYDAWDIFHWFPKFKTEPYITYEKGHAWLIDDYRIKITATSKINYVHCNLGWSGNNDGWYKSTIFDTSAGPVNFRSSVGVPKYYKYQQKIIPNITPKQK